MERLRDIIDIIRIHEYCCYCITTVYRQLYKSLKWHILMYEGEIGRAIDGDLVVIVQDDKLAELQMAGKRASLGGDTFHHASITTDDLKTKIVRYEERGNFQHF